MNKQAAWFTGAISGATLALGLTLGSYAIGAEQPAPAASMEQEIQNAKTKADHERIAAAYEDEARALHAKAEEHLANAKAFAKNASLEKYGYSAHCKNLAKRYEEAEKESLALAKIHRELAQKAP